MVKRFVLQNKKFITKGCGQIQVMECGNDGLAGFFNSIPENAENFDGMFDIQV
jgi:hypothetical protein